MLISMLFCSCHLNPIIQSSKLHPPSPPPLPVGIAVFLLFGSIDGWMHCLLQGNRSLFFLCSLHFKAHCEYWHTGISNYPEASRNQQHPYWVGRWLGWWVGGSNIGAVFCQGVMKPASA